VPDTPLRSAYLHLGGEEPLIGATIDAYFRRVVAEHPQNDAVVSLPQDRQLSYAELDRQVQALAKGLLAQGVEAGDRVGIWSTDNVEWLLLQLATARVGAVLVNINPANRVAELEHALRCARVQTLFLIPSFRSSNYLDEITELCPSLMIGPPGALESERLPELRSVVLYDPADAGRTAIPGRGFLSWQEVLLAGEALDDSAVELRAASLDFDDPINIQFTSGTTGFPKPVVLTHHNLLNNAYFVARAMRFTPADRLCVPVPFYHCFGMVLANLACLSHGAAIVIPSEHFDAGAALKAVEQERCTAIHGVPTMFVAELEQLRSEPRDLSSLRTGIMAGAPCPPELLRRVIGDMNCREILIAYGQTEASPVTHITHHDDSEERRTETVGTNLPHQEVKVVDPESGALLVPGEQGEVCFRGYHIMRGYFENPEATAKTVDEAGWLHSGDLGVMDETGYLRITGRLKDMIIRGGENLYPAEIEAFYFEHPQIAEIAVFGLPHPKWGEEVAAFVQLHEGETATPEELRAWGKETIAHFKVPAHIWIVDEFPMTVTGKIQKFRMQEIAADLLTGEDA
jgi:fatty-acyl-CoA synthase